MFSKIEIENLQTRQSHIGLPLCTQFSKINLPRHPHHRASFTKLNDSKPNYNLSSLETYLLLPRPKTNFLKRSFKCSVAMLWNNLSYQEKTAHKSVKLIVHFIILQKLTNTNIVKLPVLSNYLPS